ncbi:MAG: hypothetical protein GY838_14840, partial [bacterium]|nr:hypothetical protein [bacterium]
MDVFPSAIVDNTPAAADETAYRSQWRFDEPAADAQDWRAGSGVAGLEVRDGRLRGRSTTELPILHVERTTGLDDSDLLHAVELRLRVSQGANLCVGFVEEKTLDFDRVLDYARSEPCPMTVPIVPADRSRTFTVTSPFPVASSGIRHLLLQPTDAAGAEFEIEWVRLVFRKEHLAGLRSGISWQGLAAIYRETLVTRAPETVRFALRLPARPWLDLTLATLEEGPVTFRVGVTRARGGGGETPTVLLERTLTRSGRWESAPVELAEFAGEAVTLSLSLTAADDGALGFWGAPVVRNRVPAATGAGAGRETPQGVILIVADTLRSDHLDAYGYPRPTAPVLSR